MIKNSKKDNQNIIVKQQAQIDRQQQQIESLKAMLFQMEKRISSLEPSSAKKVK